MKHIILIWAGLISTAVACSFAVAEDWTQFRGPNSDGVSTDDDRLPMEWSTTRNVLWKAEIPGWGWACPVVVGNKVITATVVNDADGTAPQAGLYLG